MFCHHQPWSIKQWDPTFKRPSVNYTQMFLLIVFLIEIFLTWNSGCNFSIKTFSQKEQKYWKLVFVHCWTWSDGDCRSGRIVSCPKCKCWLVPRSDQLDHLTSPQRGRGEGWLLITDIQNISTKHKAGKVVVKTWFNVFITLSPHQAREASSSYSPGYFSRNQISFRFLTANKVRELQRMVPPVSTELSKT